MPGLTPPESDEPYMTIPVREFEALSQRAMDAYRLEEQLTQEREHQRRLMRELGIDWPRERTFYKTLEGYVSTLQAALRLRETFTH
jgi:hypothetical protein